MKEIKDHYFFKAKKEGYPARSVYKLIEAQDRFKFLKKGQKILDLGAAPGSWTKYAAKLIGDSGIVIAIDLHNLKVAGSNIKFIKKDIFDVDFTKLLRDINKFDVVLSDMAPKTTGRRDLDHFKSVELASMAMEIAQKSLSDKGYFYCKVFDGEDFPELNKRMQTTFKKVRIFKPKSSRAESVEKFFFCHELKK